MKSSVVLFAVALTALALGQAEQQVGQDDKTGLKKPIPRAVKTTNAPVTQDEARAVFTRAESIIRKALAMPVTKINPSVPAGTAPVTRTQVVAEFTRIYDVLRPKVKLSPSPVAFDASVLKLSNLKQKANLQRLIRLGAVAKVGPLATGPGDNLTVPEFGDAVGFFLARMAFITHQPSNKWTPGLQSE